MACPLFLRYYLLLDKGCNVYSGKGVNRRMRNMNSHTFQQEITQMKYSQGGENKVMKKKLALLLSATMAFSMFANVAFGADAAKTTQEKFDTLKSQGVFSGFPDGSAKLEQNMTRAQFAKVVVKLFGLKEVNGQYSYKDKNYGPKNWAASFIESVTDAGLMQGKNLAKKIFDFNGKVTVEEAAKVLAGALKLEIPTNAQNNASAWAKGYFEAAVKEGIVSKDVNPKQVATRSQLVEMAFAANEVAKGPKVSSYKVLDSKNVEFTMSDKGTMKVKLDKALEANKATDVSFTYKNKEGKEFKLTHSVTYEITSAQSIKSVVASNLKEIVVTFDGSLEQKSAENKNNYKIKDMKIDSVTMAEDKNSVTILLEERGSELKNQKETELEIKNVKNEDLSKTFDEKRKFTPTSIKAPEVKEVVGLGTKAYKIIFSEPVKRSSAIASNNYVVDGSITGGSIDYRYPNVVIVKRELAVGTHKVTVKGVENFINLKTVAEDKEFTIAEDTAAPEVVSAKTNDLDELEIEFNETVQRIDKIYHNSSMNTASNLNYKDNKVKMKFSNKLYNGENTIYIKGVTDYSGNKTDREYKVSPTLDSTRPEITKFKFKDDGFKHQIELTVNKKLNPDDAKDKKNFVLKDKDGKVIDNSSLGLDRYGHPSKVEYKEEENKIVLHLTGKLSDQEEYILEVSNIRDRAALPNTMMPYKYTFTAKQTSRYGATVWFEEGNDEQKLYIKFKENMDSASVLEKEKYTWDGKSITDFDIHMHQSDTVVITAKRDGLTKIKGRDATHVLTIAAVKTSTGEYLKNGDSYTFIITGTINGEFKRKFYVRNAKLVSRSNNEIEVFFSHKVNRVDADDFKFDGRTAKYATLGASGMSAIIEFDRLPRFVANKRLEIRANARTEDNLGKTLDAGFITLDNATDSGIEVLSSSLSVTPRYDLTNNAQGVTFQTTINVGTPIGVFNEDVRLRAQQFLQAINVMVGNSKAKVVDLRTLPRDNSQLAIVFEIDSSELSDGRNDITVSLNKGLNDEHRVIKAVNVDQTVLLNAFTITDSFSYEKTGTNAEFQQALEAAKITAQKVSEKKKIVDDLQSNLTTEQAKRTELQGTIDRVTAINQLRRTEDETIELSSAQTDILRSAQKIGIINRDLTQARNDLTLAQNAHATATARVDQLRPGG